MSLIEIRYPDYVQRIEQYDGVVDIPLEEWHEESGVECLLLDLDSTLVEFGSTDVPEDIATRLLTARELNLYSKLGIITHNRSEAAIKTVAEQVEADAYFAPAKTWPRRWIERKPRTALIEMALQEFGFTPHQTGMAGDKRSTDVKAALRADVARVAWVKPLGETDQITDKFFKRPWDRRHWRILELAKKSAGQQSEAA